MEYLVQIFSAFIGSLGFAMLFNVKGANIIFCTLGGGLTWSVYVLTQSLADDAFIPSLCAAVFAAAYSELLARLRKAPATIFTATSIIPLVPGSSLYYTSLSVINKDSAAALENGTATLLSAGGIAIGVVAVSVLVKKLSRSNILHR